eukprot:Opistho-1_new@20410
MSTSSFSSAFRAMAWLALAVAGSAWAQIPRTPSEPGAAVYFISPKNGETVSGEVLVRFGLRGMGVAPVGVDLLKTGHHHLLVDLEQVPAANQPIPADARHLHFGGGQTETTLKLPPGVHTLQLLLGDKNHIPHPCTLR